MVHILTYRGGVSSGAYNDIGNVSILFNVSVTQWLSKHNTSAETTEKMDYSRSLDIIPLIISWASPLKLKILS